MWLSDRFLVAFIWDMIKNYLSSERLKREIKDSSLRELAAFTALRGACGTSWLAWLWEGPGHWGAVCDAQLAHVAKSSSLLNPQDSGFQWDTHSLPQGTHGTSHTDGLWTQRSLPNVFEVRYSSQAVRLPRPMALGASW